MHSLSLALNPSLFFKTSSFIFAAFNLFPIPPLDGWGVISSFIPYKYNEIAYKYDSMSSIIFLVLIITGAYSIFVSPIINVIWDILYLFM